MFTLTIPLVEYMTGAAVVGAELTIRATTYPIVWKVVSLPGGQYSPSLPKPPSRVLAPRKDLAVTTQQVQTSPADGICRFSVDLSAAFAAVRGKVRTESIQSIRTTFDALVYIPSLDLRRTVPLHHARDLSEDWQPTESELWFSTEDGVIDQAIRVEYAAAIVGHTTADSAVLWFCLNGSVLPGYSYACNLFPLTPGTISTTRQLPLNFHRPCDAAAANIDVLTFTDLNPATRYGFELSRSASVDGSAIALASGSFTTAPHGASPLRLTFGSCNSPSSERAMTRWRELARRYDSDLMLLLGDQIYGDGLRPNEQSYEQWRDLYVDLYHSFWTRRSIRDVLRRTPTYMVLDDHEVVDDYGVVSIPPDRIKGAMAAYRIFQQSHNPGGIDGLLHYSFHWGPAAFFMMNSRTRRDDEDVELESLESTPIGGPILPPIGQPPPPSTAPRSFPILGDKQRDDFVQWAASPEVQAADVIIFAAPVPIAFLPVEIIWDLLEELRRQAGELGEHGGGWFGGFVGALALGAVGLTLGGPLGAVAGGAAGFAAGYSVGSDMGGEYTSNRAATKLAEAGFSNLTDNDLADMWTWGPNQPALVTVLNTLFDLANDVKRQPDGSWHFGPHPRAVLILGGDVHLGVIHGIVSRNPEHARNPFILHVTSSAISISPGDDPNKLNLFKKVIEHIREGLSIGELDIVKSLDGTEVDFDELLQRVFGEGTASFPLDSEGGRRYVAEFIDLVIERNYGRIEVQRLDSNHRTYAFNISVNGETKRLRQAFQMELPDNDGPVIRRDVSTSMPWIYPVSRGADYIDVFVSAAPDGIHTLPWEPAADRPNARRVGAQVAPPGACVSGVARRPNFLDVFAVDIQSRIITNAWSPGYEWWPQWQHINGGMAAPGTPVAAISRRPDFLDVFVVGDDGRVYIAWWNPGLGTWRGWEPIGDMRVPRGGVVTAVSRNPDAMDIFAVDVDGRIMTNAWEQGKVWWPQWAHIKGGMSTPGSHVGAVSRSRDKLHLFVVGPDGHVKIAGWEPGFPDWFHDWWQIGHEQFPIGGHVTVVSRSPDLLDIFAVDNEGRILTNAWSPGNAWWEHWGHVQGGLAVPGVPVTAVAPRRDKLSLFVVGMDGAAYNAGWEEASGWQGWSQLPGQPYNKMPNP